MNTKEKLARKIAKQKKPVLLMFHPGAFLFGSSEFPDDTMAAAKSQGFRPRSVDYTLGDPNTAWIEAQAKARKARQNGRKVYSYGESAGGALAIRLAQEKMAKRGAGFSPLVDLSEFSEQIGIPEFNQKQVSPIHNKTQTNNVLATVGSEEQGTLADSIREFAKQDPNVTLKTVGGTHIGAEADGSRDSYNDAVKMIMKWLAKKNKRKK